MKIWRIAKPARIDGRGTRQIKFYRYIASQFDIFALRQNRYIFACAQIRYDINPPRPVGHIECIAHIERPLAHIENPDRDLYRE